MFTARIVKIAGDNNRTDGGKKKKPEGRPPLLPVGRRDSGTLFKGWTGRRSEQIERFTTLQEEKDNTMSFPLHYLRPEAFRTYNSLSRTSKDSLRLQYGSDR